MRSLSETNHVFRRLRSWFIYLVLFSTVASSCQVVSTQPLQKTREIVIGTLYAGSGSFESSSLPELRGLKFWATTVDREKGIFIKAYQSYAKVRIVALNDKSSPKLAKTLYQELISKYHVDILVSDFGSVLTQPAISVAQEHQMVLFDQSGTGSGFFLENDPFLVLCDLPTSQVWPVPLAKFLLKTKHLRVAIIYASNPFDTAQDQTVATVLTKANDAPVANIAVPTSTTNYSKPLKAIEQLNPQAVIEFGYFNNDVAFLNQSYTSQLRKVLRFTAFPGQLLGDIQNQVPIQALLNTYTYNYPPTVAYSKVSEGLTTKAFEGQFFSITQHQPNFLNVAGYNTGVIIQAALQKATDTSQLGIRAALNAISGKLTTLEGTFEINSAGAQLGEVLPVAKLIENHHYLDQLFLKTVFP